MMHLLKSKKKAAFYILLIVIAALVVIGSYLMNRQPLGVEEGPLEKHKKRVTLAKRPTARYPEITFNYIPYSGTVTIEQDITITKASERGNTGLDGMSKDEIAAFRLERVKKYRQLNFFHPKYHPFKYYHQRIYNSITPGKGWLSPTTYYVANPYILIVVTCANHVTPLNLYCPNVKIIYKRSTIEETHTGKNALCWFDSVYNSYDYPGKVCPSMVNAWDAGFFFMVVDLARSLNIEESSIPSNVTNCVHSSRYLYHVGRYGVNNISPTQIDDWLTLRQRDVETRIYIKLWREKPESPGQSPDLVYIINVIPDKGVNNHGS
jgi:hypothetical protein